MNVEQKLTEKFLDTLHSLQYYIYLIDERLETQVHLDQKTLEANNQDRQAIESITNAIINDEELSDKALARLAHFFVMEEDMRTGKNPAETYTLENFYALKICDIYLERKLIEHVSDKALSPHIIEAIEVYDKLWEVIDDLEDWKEDCDAINSNYIVLSIKTHWTKATYEAIRSFLDTAKKYISLDEELKQYVWSTIQAQIDTIATLTKKELPETTPSKTYDMIISTQK